MEWATVGTWYAFGAAILAIFIGLLTRELIKRLSFGIGIMLFGFGFLINWSTRNSSQSIKVAACVLGLIIVGLIIFTLMMRFVRYHDTNAKFYASLSVAFIAVIIAMLFFHVEIVNTYCCGTNVVEEEGEPLQDEYMPEEIITRLLQEYQEKIDEAVIAEQYAHTRAEAPDMFESIFDTFHTEEYKKVYEYDGFYENRTFYVIIPAVEGEAEDLSGDGTYWKAEHYQRHFDELEKDKVMWGVCVRVVDGEWLINGWVKPPKTECR